MGTSKRVELTMGCHLLVLMVAGLASSHEYFPEKCPEFEPMQGFDWDQFSNGVWYVTQKFATRSTCITYEFTTDELGFKEITQLRQLPYSEKVGLDHEYKYTGKLYAANEAVPAKMNVRFPLNPIGAASFVVLDTDYQLRAHLHLPGDRPLHHNGPPQVLLNAAKGCGGGGGDHQQADRAA